ncbi:hypothetical protein FGF82_23715, partial [Salmonella sp. gx-f9]|nr:hypothetical protein [Salmonella sp. gx-f9]
MVNHHFSCSAVLAHIILREKLHTFGILGCVLCVVGSTAIVLHAPPERQIESVTEVWDLATEPGSIMFAFSSEHCFMLKIVELLRKKMIVVFLGSSCRV